MNGMIPFYDETDAQGWRKSLKSTCVVAENGLFVAKSGANVAQAGPNLAESGAFAHPPERGGARIARGFRRFPDHRAALCAKITTAIDYQMGGAAIA
jgi:hypothetical protein